MQHGAPVCAQAEGVLPASPRSRAHPRGSQARLGQGRARSCLDVNESGIWVETGSDSDPFSAGPLLLGALFFGWWLLLSGWVNEPRVCSGNWWGTWDGKGEIPWAGWRRGPQKTSRAGKIQLKDWGKELRGAGAVLRPPSCVGTWSRVPWPPSPAPQGPQPHRCGAGGAKADPGVCGWLYGGCTAEPSPRGADRAVPCSLQGGWRPSSTPTRCRPSSWSSEPSCWP